MQQQALFGKAKLHTDRVFQSERQEGNQEERNQLAKDQDQDLVGEPIAQQIHNSSREGQ